VTALASSPRTLAEAHEALRLGAVKVAGTTDLLVIDHATGREHASVLNVLSIAELQGIRVDESGLSIGAAATFAQIRASEDARRHAPCLVEAAATIGAAQIQNRATIGGNIANASPAGDSLPALLALNAKLVLAGPNGRRVVEYDTFHTDYRKTALAADELIERVIVPVPAPQIQIFRKVGTRAAQAISKAVVSMTANRAGDVLKDVRLAMGSIAATPVRLPEIEKLIGSEAPSAGLANRVAAAIEGAITPIEDVRSTAEYRKHVAGQIVRRALLGLAPAA
jgi:CO/xanthine dehydrogenase FAD-binding subunit